MPAGRPTKYNQELNKQVYKLALLGATDVEIADFLEIDEATLNRWKHREPEFCKSLKRGKLEADANVAKSLYKRANGYKYKETYFEKIDSKLNLELTPDDFITEDAHRKKVVIKELPPDVAAINIWLKNRRGRIKDSEGQRWADKQEIDHTTKGESINNIPTEELVKRAQALKTIKNNQD